MNFKKLSSLILVGCMGLALVGCSNEPNQEELAVTASLKDGVYQGSASGHNGNVNVEVEVKEGKLSNVTLAAHDETIGIGDLAMDKIVAKMNETGNTNVEVVSNATISSGAVKSAVRNALQEAGADGVDEEFNRTGAVRPAATGPFYIQKVVPSSHHTMGGVKINTNAQVIDVNGEVIEGLFAAGEITGDLHGTNRLGGNAITDCVVFGRIAGANAAKE